MQKTSIFYILLSIFTSQLCFAADDFLKEAEIKLGKKIEAIRPTQIPGIFEITSGGNIVYVDESLKYLIAGSIYNIVDKKNLTKIRLDDVQKVKFEQLPFSNALVKVRGNGRYKIAVFSDPYCVYCKKLEQELMQLDNVTIYTFLYPILSDDSAKVARDIWCSSSPTEAWHQWMISNTKPQSKNCSSPNQNNLILGADKHVASTPVIFFSDGTRLVGFQKTIDIFKKMKKIE